MALRLDRFIVQLALDPNHTVHLQGPPRAIYTFAPLGLQFLERKVVLNQEPFLTVVLFQGTSLNEDTSWILISMTELVNHILTMVKKGMAREAW